MICQPWSIQTNVSQRITHAPLMLAMGASAGTMAGIGSLATLASPILGVMGAISNVSAAKKQKAVYKREATEQRVMASAQAEQARRQARLSQSRDRAAMAESGALSGTSFGVLDQNSVAQELDALNIEFRGEQAGKSADFKASQTKSGVLDVFTSAVDGFTQMDPLNLKSSGQFMRA